MLMMRSKLLCGVFMILALAAGEALAWAPAAHRVIAIIAQHQLTPAAKVEVDRLLALEGASSLAAVANWADQIRPEQRANAPMHSVRIPLAAQGYDPVRDCAAGTCVVVALQRAARDLGNHSLPDQQRLVALKYLVHFVGDVHQPLHATGEAGHAEIVLNGRTEKLHEIWDHTIVAATNLSAGRLAHRLLERPRPGIGPVGPEAAVSWANESFAMARDHIYVGPLLGLRHQDGPRAATPIPLPANYLAMMRPYAEERLLLAGLRLGAMINWQLTPGVLRQLRP
jgi:hypothetical protein